ncbi:hypothetical protein CXF68_18310 [Tenacibaculum sp. Bg11-29]|uniref:hypothetical protein n=1 Tax=Tenacibaculum sp. Bg11-29 TaxID=2058306 RepID=UPI000C330B5A|nr:hypothetical protein [Tenacibaculum sp. Bg11-29]PKH52530.1 hypothetical protein CXF68_18310 [Tenacibaculum sp. Bg11-29]
MNDFNQQAVVKQTLNRLILKGSGQKLFSSNLNNALVLDRLSVQISTLLIKGYNEESNHAFLGIWIGTGPLNSMTDLVGQSRLTAESSTGDYVNQNIEITKGGIDLQNGIYTIGLFASDNINTLIATCTLTNGKGGNYHGTSVSITSMTERAINVSYSVPPLINPSLRRDVICLYKKNEPQIQGVNIASAFISNKEALGHQLVDISSVLMQPNETYLIQYFADNKWGGSASAIAFNV